MPAISLILGNYIYIKKIKYPVQITAIIPDQAYKQKHQFIDTISKIDQ